MMNRGVVVHLFLLLFLLEFHARTLCYSHSYNQRNTVTNSAASSWELYPFHTIHQEQHWNNTDRNAQKTLKLETETLSLPVEIRWDVYMSKTRHCYFSWRDWDVKAHIVSIAVVEFGLFFALIASWHVNVIMNYRLATSNCTHMA